MKDLIAMSSEGGRAGVTHLSLLKSPGSTRSMEGAWAPFDMIISPLRRGANTGSKGLRKTRQAQEGLENQYHTSWFLLQHEGGSSDEWAEPRGAWTLFPRGRGLPWHPQRAPPALTTPVPTAATFGNYGHRRGHLVYICLGGP